MTTKTIEPKTFNGKIFEMDGISRRTIEEHLKLYQGYVTKYNEINGKLNNLGNEDFSKGNQVYSPIRELKVELSFAWGGIVNHEIYFNHLGGEGGQPAGKIAQQIDKDFGSFENYLKDMKATGLAARGWAWTVWNSREQRLFNHLGDTQNTYLFWDAKPIVALDTYEHAYFIDYGTVRANYIDAFFGNIDWPTIENNFSMV